MNRESDEDCLALIATIRDKSLNAGFDETERLLGNLEARIAEAEEWRTERSEFRAESTRLHAKVEEAGRRMYAMERAHVEPDCPCGTESCRDPKVPFARTSERGIWTYLLRENQAEVYLPRATGESTRGDMAPLSDEQSPESGVVEPRTEDERESAHLGRQQPPEMWCVTHKQALVQHRAEAGCAVIPMEAKRVIEAASDDAIRFRGVIREEVGREVSRQLAWAFERSKALSEALERAALEAEDS